MSRRQAVIVKSRKPHRFKGMSSTTRTRTHVWAENRTDDESIPEKFSVSRKIQFSVYARGAEFSESDDLFRIVFRVRFFDSSHIVSGIFLYFILIFLIFSSRHTITKVRTLQPQSPNGNWIIYAELKCKWKIKLMERHRRVYTRHAVRTE